MAGLGMLTVCDLSHKLCRCYLCGIFII